MTKKELRARIEAMGWSQRRLARALRIDERTVRRYIAGDKSIPHTVELSLSALKDHPELE